MDNSEAVARRKERSSRARDVLSVFKLADDVYLLGSLERGVTVYSQQIRAHNLAWALWELDKQTQRDRKRIAIVGGGIGGLTAAACMLGLFPRAELWLFERTWDLCPLQQGSDSRWLHPRIYGWPHAESRFPSAAMPVLDWAGGRASDVADQILRGFGRYLDRGDRDRRFVPHVGVDHLKVHSSSRQIEWVGRKGLREDIFFQAGPQRGGRDGFDTVIVAVGFGNEVRVADGIPSYWQNDDFGEPVLDGSQRSYVVSGYGDGALVDLCRLTVERFRQDRIVYDLFEDNLEEIELELQRELSSNGDGNLYDLFTKIEAKLLTDALQHLGTRIRKDTKVVLHLAGRSDKNKEIRDVFGGSSSILNQLMLYMLFRCGAFVPSFEPTSAIREKLKASKMILRHGPEPFGHLREVFVDHGSLEARLQEMQTKPGQVARRQWEPGSFPI